MTEHRHADLTILFYFRLCPATAGSSPQPQSSISLCPLLSVSTLLTVAPQCHLSNGVLLFRLILHPLYVLLIVHLLSYIRAMCPVHFHFVLVTYWTMSVTLVPCLMLVLRILSFSLALSIFLSIAGWLASRLFTNAFVRDHAWHPYAIADKTHWLKTFLFRLMGRCLSRKISLFAQNTPSCY